jgi:hypothetical protein
MEESSSIIDRRISPQKTQKFKDKLFSSWTKGERCGWIKGLFVKNNTLQYCLYTFFFFFIFFILFTTNQHQNISTFFTFLYHINNLLLLFK